MGATQRCVFALCLVVAVSLLGREAVAESSSRGETAPAVSISGAVAHASESGMEGRQRALRTQLRLQTAGKALLAGALGFAVIGVVLIEIDPYALSIGGWGFGAVGVSVACLATAAFTLGFSRPVHIRDHPDERRRRHRIAAAPGSRGVMIAYFRSF